MGSVGNNTSSGDKLIDSFPERSTEWLKTFRDNLENGIKIVGTYSEQDAETLNALYTEIAKRERTQAASGTFESESFVVGNNPPSELERLYMDYKAIRISRYMPKAQQERLRKQKAQLKKQMDELRKRQ